MSGVLQVVGLALLGLGGAFLLGASKNPLSLIFSLGVFVALILLAQAVATRPELIEGIGVRVLSWVNSVRGKAPDTGLAKWREILVQLESVQLSRRDLLTRLPAVEVPTLVVSGLDDAICPPHFHTEIVQQMPDARLVTLDAGHLLPLEWPEARNTCPPAAP